MSDNEAARRLNEARTKLFQSIDYRSKHAHSSLAPANSPRAVIDRMNVDINAALAQPDILQRFQQVGLNARGGKPGELREQLISEIAKWKDVVAAAGIEKQ